MTAVIWLVFLVKTWNKKFKWWALIFTVKGKPLHQEETPKFSHGIILNNCFKLEDFKLRNVSENLFFLELLQLSSHVSLKGREIV